MAVDEEITEVLADLPGSRVPIAGNMLLTTPWFNFLAALWKRAGGPNDIIRITERQVFSEPLSDQPMMSGEVHGLKKRVAHLEAEIAALPDHVGQIDHLMKRIASLEAQVAIGT